MCLFSKGGGWGENIQKCALISPSTVIGKKPTLGPAGRWGGVNKLAKLLGRMHVHQTNTFWNSLYSNQIISQEESAGNYVHAEQI